MGHPDEAAALGHPKADDLSTTAADIVASANIGRSPQLSRDPNDDAPRRQHPMELPARAAGVGPFSATPSKS